MSLESQYKNEPSSKGVILLMDDDEMLKDITSRMLRHLGYSVETAADGEGAVALYRARKEEGTPFDAVILDICIPGGMGGTETLQRLMEYDPSVRAIATTGFTTDRVMTSHREFGFREALPKPYGIGQLSNAIRNVIG
jgi:CheY-like chemotaxis protein